MNLFLCAPQWKTALFLPDTLQSKTVRLAASGNAERLRTSTKLAYLPPEP